MSATAGSFLSSWTPGALVFILGLVTGSFLNAVIHRLPRGISLVNPRRSFCPGCGKTIPWHENLPLAGWLLLGGRCSGCGMPIAIRYPAVELLTAGLYLLLWQRFELPLAPVFWIFLSLLLAATFIDLDHLIIPDGITLGGTALGLLSATLIPELLGQTSWWRGCLASLTGAGTGFLLLWSVVELGKLAFGRKTIIPEALMPLSLSLDQDELILTLDGERIPLQELLCRQSDQVEAWCSWFEIGGARRGEGKLILGRGRLCFGNQEWPLRALDADGTMPVRAEVARLTLPREAMGFGDVKFLACIGAFLGWKGMLFSLFAGSVCGALVGAVTMLVTHGERGGKIPFGPYLALGALVFLLTGPELTRLYTAWITVGGVRDGFFLQLHTSAL